MNDLRDLTWQAPPSGDTKQQSISHSASSNYNPLYQRHNNPFSVGQTSNGNGIRHLDSTSASTPKQGQLPRGNNTSDSFGGLVDFGFAHKQDANKFTLAEQAAFLQAEKLAESERVGAAYTNATFFEQQLSRPSSTNPNSTYPLTAHNVLIPSNLKRSETESSEDILAQINGDRPVDKSSFYPPPPSPTRQSLPSIQRPVFQNPDRSDQTQISLSDGTQVNRHVDDDILGVLGRPVTNDLSDTIHKSKSDDRNLRDIGSSHSKHRKEPTLSSSSSSETDSDEDMRRAKFESLRIQKHPTVKSVEDDPRAPLVQQMVEMGYTTRQAQAALAQTETGLDLEAAVELLLSLNMGQPSIARLSNHATKKSAERQAETGPVTNRQNQMQNDSGDWVDTTYDLASKTLATANSWLSNKSALARRKLAEYNANTASETHASRFDERPKWMRDAEKYERKEKGKSKARAEEDEIIREEGLPMHPLERKRLEMNGVLPPAPRRGSVDSSKSAKSITSSIRSIPESFRTLGSSITGHGSVLPTINAIPSNTTTVDSRRFKANDEEAVTYVSARRRRPNPVPEVTREEQTSATHERSAGIVNTFDANHDEEEDLFGKPTSNKNKGKGKAIYPVDEETERIVNIRSRIAQESHLVAENIEEVDLFSPPKPSGTRTKVLPSIQPREQLSVKKSQIKRQIPYLDPTVLAHSSQQRLRGSESFKRGDFANALTHYNASLSNLPDSHPVRIISLTNRAITHIHLGAPKAALVDCDEALRIVGASRGVNETIEDSGKSLDMSSLWAKSMNRKASALEMQEKYDEALPVWRELVESGVGGLQAIQSRQRCEDNLLPKTKAARSKVITRELPPSQARIEAVQKLRSADTKLAHDEAQKDSLYGVVETRITTWSGGKEQNLRALLSSLDQVLWSASGWKKVTLADLVINAKVKIIYMKALAKVHPDKISRDASVEEKMIAAGVFSKLNGAWESFKQQNNM